MSRSMPQAASAFGRDEAATVKAWKPSDQVKTFRRGAMGCERLIRRAGSAIDRRGDGAQPSAMVDSPRGPGTSEGPVFYEFFAGGGMVRAGLEDWRCAFANDI